VHSPQVVDPTSASMPALLNPRFRVQFPHLRQNNSISVASQAQELLFPL
jgi:hypothetical protein